MQFHSFTDFDAFTQSIHGVESRMLQQNVKRRTWNHGSVNLGEVVVQLGDLGSGNLAEGQLGPSVCMVYLPLTKPVKYTANGEVIEKGAMAILEPGSEFCVSTEVEHEWCGVSVPAHMIDQGQGSKVMPDSVPPTVRVTRPNYQCVNQIRHLVSQIASTAAKCPLFESSPAAANANSELLKVACSAIGRPIVGTSNPVGRPKVSRHEIVNRAKRFLEQQENEFVSVGEMAAATEVSERTLRNAFREYFQVGPTQYLQLRLLHKVQRTLRESDPDETSVSKVLLRFGVFEFSHFASRYRRLFGELPSETLRRRKWCRSLLI